MAKHIYFGLNTLKTYNKFHLQSKIAEINSKIDYHTAILLKDEIKLEKILASKSASKNKKNFFQKKFDLKLKALEDLYSKVKNLEGKIQLISELELRKATFGQDYI